MDTPKPGPGPLDPLHLRHVSEPERGDMFAVFAERLPRVREAENAARGAQLLQAAAELWGGQRASSKFTVIAAVQRDGLRPVCLTWTGVDAPVGSSSDFALYAPSSVALEAQRTYGPEAAAFIDRLLAELAGVRHVR